jgi:succinate dehydrogenase/fumarate reductase flavoprotein subunit
MLYSGENAMTDRLDVSDKTAISMPMRNLLAILSATAVGVWAFFGIQERLNTLETRVTLSESDLTKNTEFRIKWPRGELGSLPADAQQDLLLEFMASQVESMQSDMESMMSNTVNIKRSQQDIERLLNDVEKLKDKIRENGNGSN